MKNRFVAILLTFAFSLSCAIPSPTSEVSYRYDSLPDNANGAVAEYRVAS
ncbi:MAG: hypothetical protein HYZ35_00240, partial [Chloroflexi bacterium]|nr:hypothetical protein [Chloroflexota bacterium]